MATLASPQQSWRWPLGWLYVLTLGLDAGLVARLGWIFFHGREYDRSASLHWLAPGLWLLLLGVGLLALVMGLENAFFRRQAGRALAWLGLSVLALGSFAAASFPLFALEVGAPSVGDPPNVQDE